MVRSAAHLSDTLLMSNMKYDFFLMIVMDSERSHAESVGSADMNFDSFSL